MCRQSRLRGRIHARPSAGGLAALCPASSYSALPLFFSAHSSLSLRFSLSVLLSFFPSSVAGWVPSGPTSARSRHRRVARVQSPRANTIYNSLGIARTSARIGRTSCLASIFRVDSIAHLTDGRSVIFAWIFATSGRSARVDETRDEDQLVKEKGKRKKENSLNSE